MTILRIVYDWPPPWLGLAPAPYYLSLAQVKLGHKVLVLTGRLGGRRLLRGQFREVSADGRLVVYNLPRALSSSLGVYFTTAPAALLFYLWRRFVTRDLDLVHGHGQTMLCFNFYRLIFGRWDTLPYIAHFHTVAKARQDRSRRSGQTIPLLKRLVDIPLHQLADRLALRVADKCLFVSAANLEEAVSLYGADRAKCRVVETGVTLDLFRPRGGEDRRSARVRRRSRRQEILYVGVLSARKNIELLLKVFSQLPAATTLRLVGRGAPNYERKLERLADELGIRERVIFEGYQEYFDLPKYYQRADLFVIPSVHEGFPKVVLEALASGVPVVASGFKSQSPIAGLILLEEPQEKPLRRAIEKVLAKPPVVDTEFVSQYCSWEAKAREIEPIYEAVLKKKGGQYR